MGHNAQCNRQKNGPAPPRLSRGSLSRVPLQQAQDQVGVILLALAPADQGWHPAVVITVAGVLPRTPLSTTPGPTPASRGCRGRPPRCLLHDRFVDGAGRDQAVHVGGAGLAQAVDAGGGL